MTLPVNARIEVAPNFSWHKIRIQPLNVFAS